MKKEFNYGVIDIGSNSVRLMVVGEGQKEKFVEITQLAKNRDKNFNLNNLSMERTVNAVSSFVNKAKDLGAKEVYIFATAAVRNAPNKLEFTNRVKTACGISVDIISGEEEGLLGAEGALNGKNGGVIDIGGASTEIVVISNGKCVYKKSLPIGSVAVYNLYGENFGGAEEYIKNVITEYGEIPKTTFYGIGGTATSVSAILQKLHPYNPNKTDGYKLTKTDIFNLKESLFSMNIEDRRKIKYTQPQRAEVLPNGVAILDMIMEKYGIPFVITSEGDNLEGYFNRVIKK